MTPDELRAIDAKVAEALGWKREKMDGQWLWNTWHIRQISPTSSVSSGCLTLLPRFSTDISAAWQVVEWLRKQSIAIVVSTAGPRIMTKAFTIHQGNRNATVVGKTAPLAICLAFLKVMGVEEGE